MSATGFAQSNSNGIEPRVSALEELTLQQQGEIDALSGGGIGWAVMDSDQLGSKPVGTVVSVGYSTKLAVVEIPVGNKSILVTVNHEEILEHSGWPLFYSNPGCAGASVFTTPDVYPDPDGYYTQPGEMQSIALFIEPGDPDSRVPYEIDENVVEEHIRSYSYADGGCTDTVSDWFVLPVTRLEDDLNGLYPPPYKLVKQQ